MPKKKKRLHWHPAFYAVFQIEFDEERDKLDFESEHKLSAEPIVTDILILKKRDGQTIHKNLGRIFRKANLVEYKSPEDYVSVRDYYKVLAYACLYVSDTVGEYAAGADQITISFVTSRFPRKMIRHLKKQYQAVLETAEEGIYYLKNLPFPTQIIVNTKLSKTTNLWLKHLHIERDSLEDMELLAKDYRKNRKNPLFEAAMNFITRVNCEKMKEGDTMCQAIIELFQDEYDEGMRRVTEQVTKQVTKQVAEQSMKQALYTFITSFLEVGISTDIIKQKLQEKYSLTEQEAAAYCDECSKLVG